jgi:ATP-grasp domain, R2K clade family 3
MQLLFPADPCEPKVVDPAFAVERQAAQDAGFETWLLDVEQLEMGEYASAVRRCPVMDVCSLAAYRGWMLSAGAYGGLFSALLPRGHRLINRPEQYVHAHHLPESYATIRDHAPKTIWTSDGSRFDLPALMARLAEFGDSALVVKDYVKSQKHYWHQACFIASARDAEAVERVTRKFIELQGESLTGGLVFREFVALESLETHAQSGMPLTKEFRLFFVDGLPLRAIEYWAEGDYAAARPPADLFLAVAAQVKSRFFTMDVALRTNGQWIIIELGDGQVAGIPERMHACEFYALLAQRLRAAPVHVA